MSAITEIELTTTQADISKLSLKCPHASGSVLEDAWFEHILAEILNQRRGGVVKMITNVSGSEYIMIDKQAIRAIDVTLNPTHEFNFDGGVHAAVVGEVIYVDTSETTEYATVKEVIVTSGSWTGNDAAGIIRVHSATNAFAANLVDNDVIEDSGATKIADVVTGITR